MTGQAISKKLEGLLIPLDKVPHAELVPAAYVTGGSVTAQVVYGDSCSMMIAKRVPGYHSKPHSHDCEQLNYVLDGEIFIYIDDAGYIARKGDMFRVPANAIHWSHVSAQGCTLLEVHAPSLIGDANIAKDAVGLFSAAETTDGVKRIPTDWHLDFDRDATEVKVKAETGASYG